MKTKTRRLVSFLVLGAIVIGTVYFLARSGSSRTPRVGEQSERTVPTTPNAPNTSHQEASTSVLPKPQLHRSKPGPFAQGAKERLEGNITDHELLILDQLYNKLVSKRERMELALAKREEVNPKAVLITIPAYFADGGSALYTEFLASLSNELGNRRGEELADKLGPSIRADNAQFGVEEQVLLIEDRGHSIHIVHGSGALVKVGNGFQMAQVSTVSNVLPQQLLSYGYLAPLFPASFSGAKK